MNLAEIEVFLSLAAELHFGRTADLLNLSQPRVSRMIRSLEGQVGGALFDRTSRRVSLTPLGIQLRDGLQTPYAQLRAGFNGVRAAARQITGSLRIGVTVTTASVAALDLIRAFQEHSPQCPINLLDVNFYNPYRALRNNRIDILINWLVLDEQDLVKGPIVEHRPRVLAVASTHPLAKRSSVSIEEVADYDVLKVLPPFPSAMLDAIVPPFTPSGRPLKRTHAVRAASEILTLVALGRIVHPTVASVPLFERDDVVLVPIHDMLPLPLGLIWRKTHENQRIRAFARFAEKFSA